MLLVKPNNIKECQYNKYLSVYIIYDCYSKVPTLILYGTKTTGYLISTAKEFAKFIPIHQFMAIDGLVHNAPDEQARSKQDCVN